MRRIGGGAASDVFEAIGPLGEVRAVKLLRAEHADSHDVTWRLTQEGRALARLDHPNLVKVIDAGITPAGRPFLVMPRLIGETLRARLDREGRLAPLSACELIAGALDGLERAHAAGIIHRDIKPANLFLARDGGGERAVLLDFGIAKMEDASFAPTTGSHVLGTPRYVSPEQILGGEIDPRTDVYAMGIMLFEALAGRPPYDAKCPIAMMRAHLEDRPKRLGAFVVVPLELERLVEKCLEKAPARRFSSAGSLAKAIRAICPRLGPEARERAILSGRLDLIEVRR